jgi:GT2 family glycosyltransferase
MQEPQATIVVVPRERFSFARRSLASVYENTRSPFELVYVDAGAPTALKSFLERESEEKKFQLLSASGYLSPNQARNLGWQRVKTKYTVFIDNDALVTPGWLDALIRCAEETAAWVVGPLYLIGEIERQTIHMAGGRIHIEERDGQRVLFDEQHLFETRISDVKIPLQRQTWDYAEFHCMLVRTDLLERLGPLDEKLFSLHEHIDLGLGVRAAGGSVFIEPTAVTSYVPSGRCEWSDLPYFMLRWSEYWNLESVRHFNRKWNVSSLLWYNQQAPRDDEEITKFARGHRRFLTGLKITSEKGSARPELPAEQAELMIAMFLSVDRASFELTNVTEKHETMGSISCVNPQEGYGRLPLLLNEADHDNLNLIIRPAASSGSKEPALVWLEALDKSQLQKVTPHAFLTLETSPERYQSWLAVDRSNWRDAATLRRLGGRKKSDVFTWVAGSGNTQREYRRPDGTCPRVRLHEATAGLLTTVRRLENDGVLAFLSSSQIF